jgi:hydrogenase expression/formation protein HypE
MRPSVKREGWEGKKMRLKTENVQCMSESVTVYGTTRETGLHALAAAVNALEAAGGRQIAVSVSAEYPAHAEKDTIYKTEKSIKKICGEKGISYMGALFSENPLLPVPAVTVHGMAYSEQHRDTPDGKRQMQGKAVVLSKWIGMDGMLQIAAERRGELEKHFAPAFMRDVFSYRQKLFSEREIEIASDMGVPVVRQILRGGIFAALWELAGELGCGLDLDLKKMSVLQETVEICEYFKINPYQLTSAGSLLFVTDDAEQLARRLREAGTESSVLGYVTGGRDKIIRNGEDIRHIDRPAPDEIFKIYAGKG